MAEVPTPAEILKELVDNRSSGKTTRPSDVARFFTFLAVTLRSHEWELLLIGEYASLLDISADKTVEWQAGVKLARKIIELADANEVVELVELAEIITSV